MIRIIVTRVLLLSKLFFYVMRLFTSITYRKLVLSCIYWPILDVPESTNVRTTKKFLFKVKTVSLPCWLEGNIVAHACAVSISVLYIRLAKRWRSFVLLFLRVECLRTDAVDDAYPPDLGKILRRVPITMLCISLGTLSSCWAKSMQIVLLLRVQFMALLIVPLKCVHNGS